MKHDELNRVTGKIVDAAVRLHGRLGPGLLESVYETVLSRELGRRGLYIERQKKISFDFEGMRFDNAFRADLVIERSVIVEIKSLAVIAAVHEKQLLTYLRLMDLPVGLILNFGAAYMKDGIRRIAHRMW